jgi:hypothetical protein
MDVFFIADRQQPGDQRTGSMNGIGETGIP